MKCPFCAEEIQDEAAVCRYCGNNVIAVIEQAPPKKKRPLLLILAFIAGGLVLACVALGIIGALTSDGDKPQTAQATKDQPVAAAINTEAPKATATVATATPTVTPLPLYWDSSRTYPTAYPDLMQVILDNKKSMTDLQFEDFVRSIKGQRVRLRAEVNEVHKDGEVYLDAEGSAWYQSVYLKGVPNEILLTLNKDQVIDFEASVREITDILILVIRLDDPIIYSIR